LSQISGILPLKPYTTTKKEKHAQYKYKRSTQFNKNKNKNAPWVHNPVCTRINNKRRKFIDKADPKPGMFACALTCVEVDREAGLSDAKELRLNNWAHVQKLDYDQLPFKCNGCHEYGHSPKTTQK
jgi:hypothetical protein